MLSQQSTFKLEIAQLPPHL